jgi:ubiquinone/menaquinone biosynthesis C-methylase UbiE
MTKNGAIQLASEPQEQVSCPLCGESSQELVFHARDRLFAQPGTYRIVCCSACGLRYLSPRPMLAGIALHYPSSYFIYQPPEELPAFVRWMARAHTSMRWRASIRRLERVLGRLRPDTRIVDVGCGLNDYLSTLRRLRGLHGIGVDFKPEVAAYVRDTLKMPIHTGTLHDARFPDGAFDIVTMNEYLEHEPNPRELLVEARRISAKGGHLVIEIPFIEGLAAKLFGSRWSQVDAPRHMVYFTRTTLSEMLRRCGYQLIHTQTFQIPYMIGVSVLQALGHRRLGRLTFTDRTLSMLAALPLLPMFPFLDEFMFAVARAE